MGLHILMTFFFLTFLRLERTWTWVKEESGKSWETGDNIAKDMEFSKNN